MSKRDKFKLAKCWVEVSVELSVGRNTAVFKRAAESLPGLFCSEETRLSRRMAKYLSKFEAMSQKIARI